MDDDIEFLDIDNLPKRSERNQEPKNNDDKKEKKKEEVKEEKKEVKKETKKEKKVKVKKPLSKTSKIIYLSIIILSVLFLGGC